jgi:MerC mercury resistance protein
MSRFQFDSSGNDRRGMLIAVLCFLHCVAGPILLSFAGLSSLVNVSERLEPLFLLGSAGIGALALIPAYRTRHGRASCLALFAAGFLCLLLRRNTGFQFVSAEPVPVTVGVTLIIAAHALNLRFSKRCACCKPYAAQSSLGLGHARRNEHQKRSEEEETHLRQRLAQAALLLQLRQQARRSNIQKIGSGEWKQNSGHTGQSRS